MVLLRPEPFVEPVNQNQNGGATLHQTADFRAASGNGVGG